MTETTTTTGSGEKPHIWREGGDWFCCVFREHTLSTKNDPCGMGDIPVAAYRQWCIAELQADAQGMGLYT